MKKRLSKLVPVKEGMSHLYESKDILKLCVKGEDELDLNAERARLTHHQANKTALEEKVLEGSLIPSELVQETWQTLVVSFRAKMIGIPTKAAPQLIGVDNLVEAEQLLQDYIYDALSQLADTSADSAGGGKDGKATASPDSKRVGRQKKAAKP